MPGRMQSSLAAIIASLCIAGCAEKSQPLSEQVRAFVAAYNKQDLDGMMHKVHADIRWYSVSGAGASLITDGREALRDEMRGFFGAPATSSSTIVEIAQHGHFVSAVEAASWQSSDGPRRQCGIVVYEFDDLLIRNVWYHEAFEC